MIAAINITDDPLKRLLNAQRALEHNPREIQIDQTEIDLAIQQANHKGLAPMLTKINTRRKKYELRVLHIMYQTPYGNNL